MSNFKYIDVNSFNSLGMQYRLDNNTAYFMERQLETLVNEVYENIRPTLVGDLFVPVKNDIPWGTESIRIFRRERRAEVARASSRTRELPKADAVISTESRTGTSFINGWEITREEMARMAIAAGNSKYAASMEPLDSLRMRTAIEAHIENFDRISLVGDAELGWTGLFNEPLAHTVTRTVKWDAALTEPRQIVADVGRIIHSVRLLTKDAHNVKRIIFPSSVGELFSIKMTQYSDNLLIKMLREAYPGIEFMFTHWLETAGAGGTPRVIAYDPSAEIVRQKRIEPFQGPMIANHWGMESAIWSKSFGTEILYPKSMVYMDAIYTAV
jgi:hypothetical protein